MDRRNHALVAASVLLAILAFHLAVAWQDLPTLARNGFLYDDSFYAFKIAQNIAEGRGITFDGVHPTNGFQPLYVFLIVPAFLVSGSDLVLPIHIALSMLALTTCLTACLLYLIARRYVGPTASLIAAAIWALSPVVTRQGANGLETAMATFMIALSFYYYVSRVRSAGTPSAGRLMLLGLVLGCTVLARIDALLFVLVVLLDYLLLLRKTGAALRRVAGAALVPLGVFVVYGPWLVFNLFTSGNALQDSGTATRFLSLAYASYFGYGPEGLASGGPDRLFILAQVTHSLSILKLIPAVHVLFRLMEKIGAALGAGNAWRLAADVFGFVGLAGIGWILARRRMNESRSRRREIWVLLLFSGLLFASYSLYIFGAFYFIRYYYPLYFVASLIGAFLLQDAFEWYRRRAVSVRRAVVAGAAVYAIFFAGFSYSQSFRSRPLYPFYDIAQWVKANTGNDDTIGAFQCGTIGYLSERRVINLDGKVNRSALVALKDGCLWSYLDEEGIDVVLDHWEILEIFLGVSQEKLGSRCVTVSQGAAFRPTDWIAFRRSPGEGSGAGSGETGPRAAASSFH
jgi:4-amino-4-deoxy-L-arabinose transferase-like glycosyltransferase